MSIPKFMVKQSISKCAWCLLPIINKQETKRNRINTVFHGWNMCPYKVLKRTMLLTVLPNYGLFVQQSCFPVFVMSQK